MGYKIGKTVDGILFWPIVWCVCVYETPHRHTAHTLHQQNRNFSTERFEFLIFWRENDSRTCTTTVKWREC